MLHRDSPSVKLSRYNEILSRYNEILCRYNEKLGIEIRKRRRLIRRRYHACGPNQVWHVASYDKLTLFGIGISGCIDGFYRYIIWMEASYTNNDPRVIAGYYVNAVLSENGCPRTIRCDKGTENASLRRIQLQIRAGHDDNWSGDRSFIYGKSTTNTRIESWLGILRKQNAEFWMEMFHGLQTSGHFGEFPLDKELMELDEFLLMWNIPQHSPQQERHNCLRKTVCNVQSTTNIQFHRSYNIRDTYCLKDELPCDEDVYDLCRLIMEERELEKPKDAEEASLLYKYLRQGVMQLM